MKDYQQEFIEFALQTGVLRFGEFTLKSGRISPYFFNTGLFQSGQALSRLGRYYAQSMMEADLSFDMMYGPAYKGIPLVAATVIALHTEFGRDVPYAFNRKEVKDHGEGGLIVGAPLQGRVLIIDDVISAGTSVRESVDIIHQAGAITAAVAISLDRQERGTGEKSAVQEVQETLSCPVNCIVGLEDLVHYLQESGEHQSHLDNILSYRETYGV